MGSVAELSIIEQLLPGVTLLQCPHYTDHRGDFTKLFHADALHAIDLTFTPAESFLTRSRSGVLRGMHFQVGDAAQDKLVFCPKGHVLDVVVDVRPGSAQFNKPVAVELSDNASTALLIRKGYGHGFLALADDSWMLYYTSTVHCPALDRGVLWSSIDFDWPIEQPIISDRDRKHPPIQAMQ
jgi:dTDP-4-dehydrorhamnose 3,5-epimerase